MSWLYLGVGVVIGIALGYVMCLFVAREIEAENRRLREGLRYIRLHVGDYWQTQALVRYVDHLLGDEAA